MSRTLRNGGLPARSFEPVAAIGQADELARLAAEARLLAQRLAFLENARVETAPDRLSDSEPRRLDCNLADHRHVQPRDPGRPVACGTDGDQPGEAA